MVLFLLIKLVIGSLSDVFLSADFPLAVCVSLYVMNCLSLNGFLDCDDFDELSGLYVLTESLCMVDIFAFWPIWRSSAGKGTSLLPDGHNIQYWPR